MAQVDRAEDTVALPIGAHWRQWCEQARLRAAPGWIELMAVVRDLQNAIASSCPPREVVERVTALLTEARGGLADHVVDEPDQPWGKLLDVPGRGQSFSSPMRAVSWSATELVCEVSYARFHGGNNDATHGGAIALTFDEVFGLLSDLDDVTRSRTATLTVDYRSITPMNKPLTVRASLRKVDGRKRWLHGELRDGDRLCAEASALYVALQPGQQ